MKYLIYGVASVMTSDEAAYAVLDYATALAQSGLADRVDVPSVDDYGMAATSSFILAPAIGVLVQSAPDDEPRSGDHPVRRRPAHPHPRRPGRPGPLTGTVPPVSAPDRSRTHARAA